MSKTTLTVSTDTPPDRSRPGNPTPEPHRAGLRNQHFPAVDGLRGIAILSVLLYHSDWFARGLFGVDAFFVLSGFLVTLLLMREAQQTGRIRIGRFYLRRYKRLMPGLMAVLAIVITFGYLLDSLQQARDIRAQAAAALFQVANWAQIARNQGYWDQFGQIQPLGAMWSLSITEQFYLVWPLILALLWWVFRRRRGPVAVSVLALFAGSAAVAPLLFNGTNSDALYLGTHTRAVGFLAGATAACLVHLAHQRRPPHRRTLLPERVKRTLPTAVGLACLTAVLTASALVTSYHQPVLYQGGFAVVAALIATLTATLCRNRGMLVKALSAKPLAEIGRMSYSMYLLHLPVYWLLQNAEPQIEPYALLIVGGCTTWLCSLFLHYGFTERLRRRNWPARRAVPVSALTCTAIVMSAHYLPITVEHRMHRDGEPMVLTLGDSLANDLATALARHGGRFSVADGGLAGCGIMSPDETKDRIGKIVGNWDACRQWPRTWQRLINDNAPDAIVVHLGWDAVLQRIDGHWLSPCDGQYRTRYLDRLHSAAAIWARAAPRTPVLLTSERTQTGAGTAAWGRCYDSLVTSFVRSAGPQVRLLDLGGFLCPHGRECIQYTPDGKQLYPTGDGVHFTAAGMDYVTPWLERRIAAQLPPGGRAAASGSRHG
ncbi:acyltransferase family protein [Streptomyces sp. NPDC001118]